MCLKVIIDPLYYQPYTVESIIGCRSIIIFRHFQVTYNPIHINANITEIHTDYKPAHAAGDLFVQRTINDRYGED